MAKTTLNFDDEIISDFIAGAPLHEKKASSNRKNRNISITLRDIDLEIMNSFCEKTGMSRSNLVRLAVQAFVEDYRKK